MRLLAFLVFLLLLRWFKEVEDEEERRKRFAWRPVLKEEENDGEELCKERVWTSF